jgi:hypothetical protein
MYRCFACDAPTQSKCACAFQIAADAMEKMKQNDDRPPVKKVNIASGEDVVLEEQPLADV